MRLQPCLGRPSIPDLLFFLNFNTLACQRLIDRAFSPDELSSLIEAVFSSADEGNKIRLLHGDDAQTFIDVIYEARSPPTRHRDIQLIGDIFC